MNPKDDTVDTQNGEHEDVAEDDIVTLEDAEGNKTEFQFLGVVEVEGEDYALLTPNLDAEAQAQAEATEIFIFRYEQDEDGGEVFSDVEDEETFQKVRAQAEALFAELEEDAGESEEELDA